MSPALMDTYSEASVRNVGCANKWSKIIFWYLSQDLKDVHDGVICRNSFFAHPENILLCTLKYERDIRGLAARCIIKSRESSSNVKSVRVFLPPKVNFQAADCTEMIDWSSITITSPPILRNKSTALFRSIVRDKKNPEWDFVHFPYDTQAVERCAKLVTEASIKVYGFQDRDGFIRSTFFSRCLNSTIRLISSLVLLIKCK
ncbi:hypothetical protein AVEN_158007-1 [Araneus ventricosus]|uniref:Uncharacterized protein n=1 Tax=Araneus ventricosus TaxID=182803 RepID=A0A4Y2V2J0_ARAVE|nr:hypothetical protein AVEN_158007-1 [Araneus ventricosus]